MKAQCKKSSKSLAWSGCGISKVETLSKDHKIWMKSSTSFVVHSLTSNQKTWDWNYLNYSENCFNPKLFENQALCKGTVLKLQTRLFITENTLKRQPVEHIDTINVPCLCSLRHMAMSYKARISNGLSFIYICCPYSTNQAVPLRW